MTPANRRLADRIETLVTKALGTREPDQLDQVIQELREALHEHAKRLREADAKRSSAA
jgi:ABC-type transporter Mla subunit MlaD